MILGLSPDPRLGPLTSGGVGRGQGHWEAMYGTPKETGEGGSCQVRIPTLDAPVVRAVSTEFDELDPHILRSPPEPQRSGGCLAIPTFRGTVGGRLQGEKHGGSQSRRAPPRPALENHVA